MTNKTPAELRRIAFALREQAAISRNPRRAAAVYERADGYELEAERLEQQAAKDTAPREVA